MQAASSTMTLTGLPLRHAVVDASHLLVQAASPCPSTTGWGETVPTQVPESLCLKPNYARSPRPRLGPSALAMRLHSPALAQLSAMLPNLDPSTNGFH